MKRLILSLVCVALFASVACGQVPCFFANYGAQYPVKTPLPHSVDTALVIAVGALADTANTKIAVGTSPDQPLYTGLYIARKCAIHKMDFSQPDVLGHGPVKQLIWFRADQDPGRGRFKTFFVPAIGPAMVVDDGTTGVWPTGGNLSVPAGSGYFGASATTGGSQNCLGIVLVPEGTPTVTLMCTECGEIYTETPVIAADGSLLNSVCPVCGGTAITADTLTPETVAGQ